MSIISLTILVYAATASLNLSLYLINIDFNNGHFFINIGSQSNVKNTLNGIVFGMTIKLSNTSRIS
jgi:hypothetical protein